MEDYTKYILYAVIAILYILFKVFGKKKPATTNDSSPPLTPPQGGRTGQPLDPQRGKSDGKVSPLGGDLEGATEPDASPTETEDKPSTFKGSIGELLKEFIEGPKQEEFDPESFDREDELRYQQFRDSEYQDEDSEPEEIEIIADPPRKTYERAWETGPPLTPPPAGGGRTGQSFPPPEGKGDGKIPPPAGGGLREAVDSKEATAYSIEEEEQSKYARILRDPQNAKEAFIMSEIFKKKYE